MHCVGNGRRVTSWKDKVVWRVGFAFLFTLFTLELNKKATAANVWDGFGGRDHSMARN